MFSTDIFSELHQIINDLKTNPDKYKINISEDKNGATALTLDGDNSHCRIHLKEKKNSPTSVSDNSLMTQTNSNQVETYNIKTKEPINQNLNINNENKKILKQNIEKIKTSLKEKSSEINKNSKLNTIQNKTNSFKELVENKAFQYFTKLDCDNYFKPKIFDNSDSLTKEKLDTFISNLIENNQKDLTKIFHPFFDIFVKDCQQEKEPINTKTPESTNSSLKSGLSSLDSVRNELYSSITNYLYFLTGNKDIVELVFPKQIFDQKFRNLEKTIRNMMT